MSPPVGRGSPIAQLQLGLRVWSHPPELTRSLISCRLTGRRPRDFQLTRRRSEARAAESKRVITRLVLVDSHRKQETIIANTSLKPPNNEKEIEKCPHRTVRPASALPHVRRRMLAPGPRLLTLLLAFIEIRDPLPSAQSNISYCVCKRNHKSVTRRHGFSSESASCDARVAVGSGASIRWHFTTD
ncbi:hypothetical protein BDP55DRAFT_634608 [Colletotrichum godetiae]|uniref:Uncharacterized protein n=1 Tax=Colletotrichum godetiae TaxID=1209918 RepID=A0AAJ0AFB5_9PEZI|nr:uncharacterized protein BDP55DRAFT_634608 [Colletotrichum godetiae]KAK1672852.1 hypothetical protein BDP55DRAFT_634608 [Colletotrichum godetiae]